MKTIRQNQNLFASISWTVASVAFIVGPLRADYAVTGDLDVQQNIDYGTTNASPATSAVLQAYSAGSLTARWDLTPNNGIFLWRDNALGTLQNKMKLDGNNILSIYKADGSATTITLNSNTGVINLSGTGSGIYSNGAAVFTASSASSAVVFADRPVKFLCDDASSSKVTGALTVAGGVGVAGTVYANAINTGSLTLNNQSLSAWLTSSNFVTQASVDAKAYQTAPMVDSAILSKGFLTSASAAAAGFLKQANVDAMGYQTAPLVDSAIISKGFLTSASATDDGFLKQANVDAMGYQTAADVSAELASRNLVTATNIQAALANTPQIELGNTTIQGDATLNGKITISQPQGDISMGIYGGN